VTHRLTNQHGLRVLLTPGRLALLVLISAAAVAAPVWEGWKSYKIFKASNEIRFELADRQGPALYLDEALTMSARMAAATGDLKWVDRYYKYGGRTRLIVEECLDDPELNKAMEELVITGFKYDKLDILEQQVLDLVQKGKRKEALAVLDSEEYLDQKEAYAEGVKALSTTLRESLDDRCQKNWRKTVHAMVVVCIVLPLAAVAWLIVLMVGSVFCEILQSKRTKGVFAREWQKTFNAITDGVCIIDCKSGKIMQCNTAMTRFLKRPYNEIIERTCCELLHGSPEPVKRCPLNRMLKTHRSEVTDFKIDNRWFNIKVDPVFDTNRNLVAAVHIISDISDRRKASRSIREGESKFRLAFANAQDAIVWIEAENGRVTNCNKAAESVLGRAKKDILGQHHTALYPLEKKEHYHRLLFSSDTKQNSNIEAEIVKIGGEKRIVTISVSTMIFEEKEILQGIIRDVTDHKRAVAEIKSLAKFPSEDPNPVLRISDDCRIIYANAASSSVLNTWKIKEGESLPEPWHTRVQKSYHSNRRETYELNTDDEHVYFVTFQPIAESGYSNVYALDITKRKKAEKEKIKLELQMGQKQKMEAIGTLAGGIAHDFNNILGALQGYVELSLDDPSDAEVIKYNLKQMMSCIGRATKLVKQILNFSRKDMEGQEKELVEISSIITEVFEMLQSSLPNTVQISRQIHTEDSTTLADPTQINQVLINLCTNALHAMRDKGGRLEVSLEDVNLDAETVVGDENLQKGLYLKLSVSDSGCGIDTDTLERIFEPFFTTKEVGEGTGLGLSVVHGIIKSHKGAISVSSTIGRGTTFEIFLPKVENYEPQKQKLLESGIGST